MFSRIPVALAISVLAACPLLAAATPLASAPAPATSPLSTCSTGPVQCCNSVQPSNSPEASSLLGLLGIVLGSINIPIGITCNPITVIGAGGSSCNAQTVCCENNSFHGTVAIGCTPATI